MKWLKMWLIQLIIISKKEKIKNIKDIYIIKNKISKFFKKK